MSSVKDLTGRKFGRLTALSYHKGSRQKKAKWLCKCICGNTVLVDTFKLISGHTKSCGCLQRERASLANKKHGLRNTRIYKTWCNMKSRCFNKNHSDYYNYGGRGITVCDEWKNDFKAFYDWAISNGYRDDLTIDRIDVNGNYEPNNCRWETNYTQALNKNNTVKIKWYGELRPLKEICNLYNVDYFKAYDVLIRSKSSISPEEYFNGGGANV